MVQGSTQFTNLANGNKSRICFEEELVKVNLPKKTPTKQSDKNLQNIEFYPNYKVSNFQIDLSSRKPKEFIVENFSLKLASTCVFKHQPELNLSLQELNKLSRFAVQVHFIAEFEGRVVVSWCGTGVLVECRGASLVLTTLHTFITPEDYQDLPLINSYIIITSSEVDKSSLIADCLLEYESNRKAKNLLEFIEVYLENLQFWFVNMDESFLKFRKEWLENIQKTGVYTDIIDPLSQMKPSPAFDLAILKLDTKASREIKQGGNAFYDLDGAMASDIPKKRSNLIYLFGYNGIRGTVDFTGEEYQETLIIEGEGAAEDKPELKLLLSKFLHSSKSLSAGKCVIEQGNFIIYKASMAYGSSGGPLFDSNGVLLGISLGNFCDVEKQEPDPISDDLKFFDIKCPEEKIMNKSRNYNLGVSILHNGLLQYLYHKSDTSEIHDKAQDNNLPTKRHEKHFEFGDEEMKVESKPSRKAIKSTIYQALSNPIVTGESAVDDYDFLFEEEADTSLAELGKGKGGKEKYRKLLNEAEKENRGKCDSILGKRPFGISIQEEGRGDKRQPVKPTKANQIIEDFEDDFEPRKTKLQIK